MNAIVGTYLAFFSQKQYIIVFQLLNEIDMLDSDLALQNMCQLNTITLYLSNQCVASLIQVFISKWLQLIHLLIQDLGDQRNANFRHPQFAVKTFIQYAFLSSLTFSSYTTCQLLSRLTWHTISTISLVCFKVKFFSVSFQHVDICLVIFWNVYTSLLQ